MVVAAGLSKFGFATDSVLRKRFVPVHVLRRGHLTNVYLVRDRTTLGQVVLKVPQEHSSQDARVLLRNEARALGLVQSEQAVRLLEHGTTSEGTPYFLTAYERGEPLTAALDRAGPPAVGWCVGFLEKLLSVLSEVHDSGVVHGDVSPGNCLVVDSTFASGGPEIRLLDFGAARFAGREKTAATFGTAAYASPECVLGEEISPSSDIYSAGILAYELLSGHRPFRAGTTSELVWQHLYQDPETFPTEGRGQLVPRQLVDAIGSALLKDPKKRLSSAAEFAAILRDALQKMERERTGLSAEVNSEPASRSPNLRAAVLERLRVHWLEGVLGEATAGFILVRQRVIDDKTLEQRSVCDAQTIHAIDSGNHLLLLTGEAGYGKTVNLLRIARVFADRAESRTDGRLPIVLGLGSWKPHFERLEDWLTVELQTHYLVPPKVTREWVRAQPLVLLLDGLDELEDREQQSCVDAIDCFRKNHSDVSLVVASRPDALARLARRPEADAALRLLSLMDADIRRQLPAPREAEFCRAIESDPVLADAIRTPILLHVARRGFKQRVALGDAQTVRVRLFEGFLDEIAEREASGGLEFGRFRRALQLIARAMSERRAGTFLYESLQPTWLPSVGWKLVYLFLTRMVTAAVYAAGIICAVGLTPLDNWGFETSLAFGLELAIVGGLVLGIVTFAHSAAEIVSKAAPGKALSTTLLRTMSIGLVAGILTVLAVRSEHAGARTMALETGLLGAFVLVQSRRGRSVLQLDIGQREQHSWSPKSVTPVKWVPLLIGSGALFVFAVQFETVLASMYLGLAVFVVGMTVAGLGARPALAKMTPNIGTWLTVKSAAVLGVVTFVAATLLVSLNYGIVVGAAIGLNLGSILFLWGGGIDVIHHLILRMLLLVSGVLPEKSLEVLTRAGRLGLVRRTGNGFFFIHAMLQEHLGGDVSVQVGSARRPLHRWTEENG